METKVKLRQYQADLVEKILKTEHRKTICQLDTAGGKSVILSEVCRLLPGIKYIVAHRIELLNQLKNHICQWVEPDQISVVCGNSDIDFNAQIFLVSAASLSNNINFLPEPSLIVIDEAHHAICKTYRSLFDRYPSSKILGMTATPERLDGKSLGDIFDNLICGPLTSELSKFVAEYDYYAPEWRLKDEGCLSGKEFSAKKILAANSALTVAEELYKIYKSLLYGKSTLIFAQSIEHSQSIQTEFTKRGIRCFHLDGTTNDSIRMNAMADLSINKIDVITSVNLFDEGIDIPSLQGVLIARRTASLSKYLQMCGRIKRKNNNEKKRIVDCTNNWEEHGLPTFDRIWTLGAKGGKASELIGLGGMRRNKITGQIQAEVDENSLDYFEIVYRKVCENNRRIDYDQFDELYNKGLNDTEIAKILGCSSDSVARHRGKLGYLSNKKTPDFTKFRELYDKKMFDSQIAEECGYGVTCVHAWRKKNNLPAHGAFNFDEKKAKELYEEKSNDTEIALALGCNPSSVAKWRKKNNLPKQMFSVDWDKVRELYEKGFVDIEIAKAVGCSYGPIGNWRRENNLKPNTKHVNYTLVKELYDKNLSDKEIGETIGCSPLTISLWRRKNKFSINSKK